jgi:AraC family transcriptional regulator of adaptative response / DNA-3-methyladenine glycosylase II
VPGVEHVDGRTIHRAMALPFAPGAAELELHDDAVLTRLRLGDMRDLPAAVQRCRRWLDLDADPEAIDPVLGADRLLGPLVARAPGVRSPGAIDAGEMLVRAIVGQQVSVAAARTVLGRLADRFGDHLRVGVLTRTFPRMEALAGADPDALPMPRRRARALVTAARAVASGDVDLGPGADRGPTARKLLALPGVGPWTVSYVLMRGLGDPDVLLSSDLGVRRALHAAGVPAAVPPEEVARRWRPWRSYATHHLWLSLRAEGSR